MPLYESIFIVRPDVSGQHVDGMAESFATIVGEHGGQVTKTENWGLRSLAYRINKNRKGHYVLMNIDAPAAAMTELRRNMGIDEDVVRHLTVRVDELESGPSPMMQSRAARDERSRRDRGGRGDRRPDSDGAKTEKAPEGAATAAADNNASGEPAPASEPAGAAPATAETDGGKGET